MEQLPFVFTVTFMLLGPIKIIPGFARLMRGSDIRFQKEVAKWGVMIAAALCAFVVLAGTSLLGKYRISIDGLRISGGLVLLIAALQAIFKKSAPIAAGAGTPTAIQLAASPIAVPLLVPPAGVAALLILVMLEPQYPGITKAVVLCLAIMMALNFLVMRFIDSIVRVPGLAITLSVLGSVLVFMQLGLAVEMILSALRGLGVTGV